MSAMHAKNRRLEASLATATSALQQLSTQQAVHSTPKPPKPDKFHGDRRSGAASNWLHQMTLYFIFWDSWTPRTPSLMQCPSSLALPEPDVAPKKLLKAHQPPGQPSSLPSLRPSGPLKLSTSPETTWRTSGNVPPSVTDYAYHFSGLLLEVRRRPGCLASPRGLVSALLAAAC